MHRQQPCDLPFPAKFQDNLVAEDDPFAAAPSSLAKRQTEETH